MYRGDMQHLASMTPKTVMARLVRAINALQDRELARLGIDLTAQQAAIVTYVELDGPKPIGEIAVRVGVDQSVATRLVDRLESKGLVARGRAVEDRRAVLVSASRAGSRAVAVAVPRINALKQRVFTGIDDADIEAFWRVLTTIENNITAMSQASSTSETLRPTGRATRGVT
jgi:MarR family transcriptional regulator for hemolysin